MTKGNTLNSNRKKSKISGNNQADPNRVIKNVASPSIAGIKEAHNSTGNQGSRFAALDKLEVEMEMETCGNANETEVGQREDLGAPNARMGLLRWKP